MRRADRLFRIVQRLRRRDATTARQLAEALEVSERTVYRDIRDLLVSGVPTRGQAGGERVVRPLGHAYWGHTWALTAWCEMRSAFRNFRPDRIDGLQILEDRFEDEPGRTLADFLALVAAEERAVASSAAPRR